jgi:ribulose-5-phosphate 4-epimerase/fuculose-1-phosphate aldolase
LIYRSNLLGADLRLTNYGGGNTSCKAMAKDPLTGVEKEVMWVKGSGGDIGTLKKSGLAALHMDRLLNLKNIYRGIQHEDEMVELFNHCIYDLASKAPSIDTALHGFLPFKHIDHLHPDAAIAIAAAKDGKKITQELFEGKIGWVGWQKPGFDLGLQLKQCLDENPGIIGIMLGSHGLFTWGDTAYESYLNTLEVVERCSIYLEKNYGKKGEIFGGAKLQSLPKEKRLQQLKCTESQYYSMKGLPSHIQLAEKMKLRGKRVEAGTRLEHVVIDNFDIDGKLFDKIESWEYFKENKNILRLDFYYYLKLFINPLDQIVETAFGIKDFTKKIYKYHILKYKTLKQLKTIANAKLNFI